MWRVRGPGTGELGRSGGRLGAAGRGAWGPMANVLRARKFISAMRSRDGWVFSGTAAAGKSEAAGKGGNGRSGIGSHPRKRGEKKCSDDETSGDPGSRVLRIYGMVHTRAYKPHNSPSGDPYPTNFQIINISVAALLRAS